MNNINTFTTDMERRAYRQGRIDGAEDERKEILFQINDLETQLTILIQLIRTKINNDN